MLDQDVVLKSDELFLTGEVTARPTSPEEESASGLYLRDTRHLSRFDVTLGGRPLRTLAVRTLSGAEAVITGGNQAIELEEERLWPLTVAVEQRIEIGSDLRVRITVQNHAGRPIALPLTLGWAADFRDMFDVRGFHPEARGTQRPPRADGNSVTLAYHGLDEQDVATTIAFNQPAHLTLTPPGTASATFKLHLAVGEAWTLNVTVTPQPVRPYPVTLPDKSVPSDGTAPATIVTDNPEINAVLTRSAADLAMLRTSFPEGSLPAAGIPWFVAPFGRDSLIVGLQTVHLDPQGPAGTLRVLAALQGTKDDPWREEQPGKILHEMRYGEMARRGEMPHSPYYGSVDSTPLWLMLLAEVVAWSGDMALYRELLPNARRALEWIEGSGDPDGDGLLEYFANEPGGVGLIHQNWKDSFDSLNHTDGTPVYGSIAAVEVQGYAFAAYQGLAEVAELAGDTEWTTALRAKAERIRAIVEERFWLEDEGFYAQALDAEKRPVRAVSSNPGHLLFCGLPSPERAARVAERLLAPDMDSGWGIRTLSSAMPTYNPMSYHNGSVWPHDNSLIVAGLRRYGHRAAAQHFAESLFAAAISDPLQRLPELYSGFDREASAFATAAAPVPYPVSCSPQAWAAATPPLLVASLLGLRLDAQRGQATVEPDLPAGIDELTVEGLSVRGKPASVTVKRLGDEYRVTTSGPIVKE